MYNTEKQKKSKHSVIPAIILIAALLILCLKIGTAVSGDFRTADLSNGWNLILVNRDNHIPKHYQNDIELTYLSNGKQIDSRILPDLQAMFNDARASGHQLFVREGFRTEKEQQRLLDDKITAFQNEGHTRKESEKLAMEWVAVPGTSEHEIGIAVDINSMTADGRDALYSWLENNSYKYGFIRRYSPEKADITGVSSEPWHYRYVGREAAETIYSQGLCLEEYIALLDQGIA